MEVEFTTIGERGQVVIPAELREKMPAPKGTLFSVYLVDKDILVLKKIDRKELVKQFHMIRDAIRNKLDEEEIVEELKKSRED